MACITAVCQVKSGFVLEADIKTISRQIISIVTQVKRDRELKQQADAVKESAHATVQAAQSVPGGAVTSSSALPQTAATATQQTRVAGTQPAGTVAAAVTSPAAVPPTVPAQSAVVENTSSAHANGLPASSAVAPVAATLQSVVTVAGPTSTVNTVTASVNVAASQATHAKPLPGLSNFASLQTRHICYVSP